MVKRLLNPIKNNSFFIFGARGTGKSTFIKEQFSAGNILHINLLDPEIENQYSLAPQKLKQEILALKKRPNWVVIDEIQKVPKLLDIVHLMIESEKQKFILTGSSARKLKRGAANLLAGRAYVYNLYPFCSRELGKDFNLSSALHWGLMPKIFSLSTAREKIAYLNAYTLTYLNEEIRSEQILRKLDPFRAFLPILGQVSGKIVNHKKIADEIGVSSKTVQSYFQIIEDTLLGFYLPAFHLSVRKSQKSNPKFYLIDTGIKKTLEGSLEQIPVPKTSVYGELFEQFIVNEVVKTNTYFEKNYQLSYYATKNGAEVDLVLSKAGKHTLVEIKSKDKIDETEVRSLYQLAKEFKGIKKIYYVSNDKVSRKIEDVHCLHWQEFLTELQR